MGTATNEIARREQRKKVQSVTVRYRTATLGDFIEDQSYDVSSGGTFVETTSPLSPGTLLKFELQGGAEKRAMHGVGRVVWKRDKPGESGDDPAGMGIKFIKIDDGTQSMIDRIVEAQEQVAPVRESLESPPTGAPRKSVFGRVASVFSRS